MFKDRSTFRSGAGVESSDDATEGTDMLSGDPAKREGDSACCSGGLKSPAPMFSKFIALRKGKEREEEELDVELDSPSMGTMAKTGRGGESPIGSPPEGAEARSKRTGGVLGTNVGTTGWRAGECASAGNACEAECCVCACCSVDALMRCSSVSRRYLFLSSRARRWNSCFLSDGSSLHLFPIILATSSLCRTLLQFNPRRSHTSLHAFSLSFSWKKL
mmetsp:Transcript_23910/g.42366  ORF Transcript_23910/g.42366 Transcript_23910/m.42366 type:complete len:218 (+) Transcript_23910:574-1227(+)